MTMAKLPFEDAVPIKIVIQGSQHPHMKEKERSSTKPPFWGVSNGCFLCRGVKGPTMYFAFFSKINLRTDLKIEAALEPSTGVPITSTSEFPAI